MGTCVFTATLEMHLEHLQRCSVCDPAKKQFTSKFSYVLSFAMPPIRLKRGEQIGGVLLITNHLDQSLWWANKKHSQAVRSYLIHSFLWVHIGAAPFTKDSKLSNYAEPNRQFSTFLHPILLCRIMYWALLEMPLVTVSRFVIGEISPKSEFQISKFENQVLLEISNRQKWEKNSENFQISILGF